MDTLLNERTRIGWHPITLGLVLVVIVSLLRGVAAFAMRQQSGSIDIDLQPTLPGALFLLGAFVVGSVGLIGGGLFGLAGVSWERLGWRRDRLLREIGRGLLGCALIGIFSAVGIVLAVKFLGLTPPAMDADTSQFSWGGIVMSVLFGFFIGPFFVLAFGVGVILGWMRGHDGSLVAPFIAHGLIG